MTSPSNSRFSPAARLLALAAIAGAGASFAQANPIELVYNISGVSVATSRSAIPGFASNQFTNFGRVNRTPDGTKWWVIPTTNFAPATADQVLLAGSGLTGTVLAREGVFTYTYTPAGGSPVTEAVSLSAALLPKLNDNLSWALTFTPVAITNSQRVIKVIGTTPTVLAVTGQSASPALPDGIVWGTSFASANISNAGVASFQSNNSVDILTPSFEQLITNDGQTAAYLLPNAQILNPDGSLYTFWSDIDLDGYFIAGDGVTTLIQGRDGATPVLAFNNRRVLTGGENIRGTSIGPITGITESLLELDGRWIARVSTATGNYYLHNGTIIAGTALPITPGSAELWTGTFQIARANNFGDFVVIGTTNNANTLLNEVVVLNGVTVITRESDAIDVDNNGVVESAMYVGTFRDRAALLNNELMWSTRVKAVPTSNTSLSGNAALLRQVLPIACLADVASDSLDTIYNPNGSVGSEDLDAFIAGFIAGDPAIADVASDSLETRRHPNGSVGSEDLDAFIASFIAGC